jgi:integrase
MASIRIKNNKYYLLYYDRATKKQKSKCLNLKATKRNQTKANQIAKEFQKALDEKYKSISTKNGEGLSSTIDKAISHFYKINQNKSKKTLMEYKNFFSKFIDNVHFKKDDLVGVITKSSIEDWILSIDTKKYQQNTLYGITKNLNKFLNFLFEYDYIPYFKLNKDLKFKPEEKEITIFSKDDIKLMFDNLKDKNTNFKLAFYFLFYTGLRPSDIVDIKRGDIDLENSELYYYSIKTKKHFRTPLNKELITKIKPLIKDLNPNDKIMTYKNYDSLTREINKFLRHLSIKNTGYNARTFRKTFISLAYENNVDYVTTSELVGHSNISTTKKYYTKLSMDRKHAELNKLKFPTESKDSSDDNI